MEFADGRVPLDGSCVYIYVVGTFRVYFVPLRNPIIIEKSQQNLLYIGNISLNRVPIK